MHLKCPHCEQISECEDIGVGWKCSNCPGKVFTSGIDTSGIIHHYWDPTEKQKKLIDQEHVFDLDATDLMVGVVDQSPFYGTSLMSQITDRLTRLADNLDEQGLCEDADKIDKMLKKELFKKKEEKRDPYTKQIKEETNTEVGRFPIDYVYSLSGSPLSNL